MRTRRIIRNTKPVIHIVGEGLTELYYFSHLKKLNAYRCSITPLLFENNSINTMEKKIKELVQEDVYVVCVFDADVSRRNNLENEKLQALKQRYARNKNVLLCDSLQAIEYWFLLHYEDTNRYFQNAGATTKALKKYLPDYDKTRKFLENNKWIKDMLISGKLSRACELAEKYVDNGLSYSPIYQAVKILQSTKFR